MSENTGTPPEAAQAPAEKKPKHEKKAKAETKIIQLDTGKDYKKLILPKDESDPHWDPRMEMDVPEGLIQSMVDEEIPTTLQVEESPDGYLIDDGRTRVRAIPEVNKRRKKLGLPPFQFTLAVHPPKEDSFEGTKEIMLRGMRSNVRLDSPPTVVATEILRWLSADISEEEICKTLDMSVATLHATLSLLDLPKGVQKMVDDGTISKSAALGLVKLDADKVQAAADALAAAARHAGGKVTAKDVARVSGKDEKVATQKQKKQWLLDLQSYKFAGKHGEAVKWALIIATEVGLGTRSIDQAIAGADRISRGDAVKVDFKQYQTDGKSDGPVKGQK